MARRGLSAADRDAWAAVARLIRPLPGRSLPDPAAPPPPPPPPLAAAPIAPAPARRAARRTPPPLPALVAGQAPAGLDAATWQRLRRGRMPPERKLDLHGRTAQNAFDSLAAFLRTCHAGQIRCVEIVTGRGSAPGSGVIRRELPHWLERPELRALVLALVPAPPDNPGAVWLLLRRRR